MQPVAVLMLAYNKIEHTRVCLNGLLQSTYPHLLFELVDNGSNEPVEALFREFGARAAARGWETDVVRLAKPAGAIGGRNAGFERLLARNDLRAIALVDNDVMPRHLSWVERLVERLEATPRRGIVGPKLVYPNPPHLIQCAGCEVSPEGKVDFAGRGLPRDTPAFEVERPVQALISACWLMRPEFPRTVGLLDDRFSPVQYEDVDYCYRVREAGFECVYTPAAEMYHFENTTTDGSADVNYTYVTVKNGMKFKAKWQHRFALEQGRPARDMVWREIPRVRLDVTQLPEQLP
ncbi:MAG: glycosyltransferase family 2 protein [Planctomycetota bacterium]